MVRASLLLSLFWRWLKKKKKNLRTRWTKCQPKSMSRRWEQTEANKQAKETESSARGANLPLLPWNYCWDWMSQQWALLMGWGRLPTSAYRIVSWCRVSSNCWAFKKKKKLEHHVFPCKNNVIKITLKSTYEFLTLWKPLISTCKLKSLSFYFMKCCSIFFMPIFLANFTVIVSLNICLIHTLL